MKIPSQEDYRETELGFLPKDWEVKKVSEIAGVKYGKSKPVDTGNVPVIGSSGTYDYTSKALIDYPTIVIGRKGNAGKPWLCLEPCYPSDTTFYLVWKGKVDPKYVFSFLSLHPFSGEHAKTTVPSLQKPDLENLLIPLPSIKEQEQISFVLSTIQAAQEKSENLINSLKELKKSLMKHLFTYGTVSLSESKNVELKETELGMLSKQWSVGQIGVEFEIKSSILTYQQMEKINDDKNGVNDSSVMAVKVSDMNLPKNKMYFLYSNLMKKIEIPNIEKKTIPKDSIIFPKRGAAIATNKKRISTTRTVLDPNLISLVKKSDNIDVVYFYYWFLTFDLRNITVPGPTPQLNKKDVFPILFPFPPIQEQQQIASILCS